MNLRRLLTAFAVFATVASFGQKNDLTLTVQNQQQDGTTLTFDLFGSTSTGTSHVGEADIVLSTTAAKWTSLSATQSNVHDSIANISVGIVSGDIVINLGSNYSATGVGSFPRMTTTPTRLMTITVTDVSGFATAPGFAFETTGNPKTTVYEVYSTGSRLRQAKISNITLTAPAAATAPTGAIAAFAADMSTPGQAALSWTAPAADSVMIVAREGSAVATGPANTVSYTSDNAFASGAAIHTGADVEYVVARLDGNATTATITGLTSGNTYHFTIYKFAGGSGFSESYFAAATATGVTLQAEPTTAPSNIAFASITTSGFNIAWDNGNGANVLVVLRETTTATAAPADGSAYSASTDFSSPNDTTGTDNVVLVSATTGTTNVTVTGLTAGTQYTVELYAFNGSGSDNNYLTSSIGTGDQYSMFGEPSTSFAGVTVTTQSANTIDVTWTDPSEAANDWIIVARLNTDAATAPTAGTAYTADAAYTSGAAIGNGYVVYNGDGSAETVTITGLDQNEKYAFDIYAYTGTDASDDAVLNYSNSAEDNGTDVTWINADLVVYLEGLYNTVDGDMDASGITVPASQPYTAAPWSYSTATTNTSGLSTVVDWVLVEFRTGASASAATTIDTTIAALLLEDGSIVAADGGDLVYKTQSVGTYYVAVHHRNHLAASSAAAMTDNGTSNFTYDFSSAGATGTEAMYDITGSGDYVLYGGWVDPSTDDVINAGDFSAVFSAANTTPSYSNTDANLDGAVDAADRAIVFNNRDYSSQVPE